MYIALDLSTNVDDNQNMETNNTDESKRNWLQEQLGNGWEGDYSIDDVVICERCDGYELSFEINKDRYCGLDVCNNCADD